MYLCFTERSLKIGLFRRSSVKQVFSLYRHRHSCCALSSDGLPCAHNLQGVISDSLTEYLDSPDDHNTRVPWNVRLIMSSPTRWSKAARKPFSEQPNPKKYCLPHVRALLKGFWSLDRDPIWLLVDDLVTSGESPAACPEFPRWKHIVMATDFSEAISTLVSQGNLRNTPKRDKDEYEITEEENDEDYEIHEDEVDDSRGVSQRTAETVPTWLVAFILTTMLKTRAAAYEGLAFCLSQLDATPGHLRASLLLLSMCSLSAHRVAVQVPVLLSAFCDVFSDNQTTEESKQGKTSPSQFMGSKDVIIYQYNALLTLLSQFPRVPGFERRTVALLQYMDARGVMLQSETARQIIAARFASEAMVACVRDILDRQGTSHASEEADDLAVSLMRFYSRRANQAEAAKFAEVSYRVHPGRHVQAYLTSFRDAAASFAYIQKMQDREEKENALRNRKEVTEGVGRSDPSGSTEASDADTPSSDPTLYGVPKRHIHISLLRSAAVSQSISAMTFREMFDTIREAYGDDRELETVALSGMLRRKAWEQAKDIWYRWQTTNRSIRSLLREMATFVNKREMVFGDSGKVRRTLGWTNLTEQVTYRRMKMLSVDASSLAAIVRAIGGPKPDSLPSTFKTMDDYALKNDKSKSPSVDSNLPDSLQSNGVFNSDLENEQIKLTSRVINCFMVRAMYFRRPDIVFRLWDEMTSYYGVDSSVGTMIILLRSARIATGMESSLSKFVPRWMMGSRGFFGGDNAFPNLTAEILWMLSPECTPKMQWNDAPPWRVARHVFREELILANWPWLRQVDVPAQPVRRDDAIGRMEALKELSMKQGGLWGTNIRKMGKYPHILPNSRVFREYIIMLSRVGHSSEIPEALAWMRALEIPASRQFLSICLALWSQVGLESLADDAWNEARSKSFVGKKKEITQAHQAAHGGEYAKLLDWMEDWMGNENLPDESDVMKAFKYLEELEEKETFLY